MHIVCIGEGLTKRHSAETVGAKAANLARMAAIGLPVPPAFVLPVKLCEAVVRGESDAKKKVAAGLADGIAYLETATGKRLGDRRHPLLVSVRSGAARSMPGMLDTVLDVGCTPAAVHGLVRVTGHPRFAWDCRRRFLESYGGVVLGIEPGVFAARFADIAGADGVDSEQALDGEALERVAGQYQQIIDDEDSVIPDDPMEQLEAAAYAVYRSWNSERARTYRRLEHLDHLHGTAVTIQVMVFGNQGRTSGAGVAFSRDPSSGAAQPVIDVLFESQGEDVVSGRRNPDTESALTRALPATAAQLHETLAKLEVEFRDVQDVEFTIEDGKLWMLQTRAAKRTPQAALRFAVDLAREGLITPAQALQRLNGINLDTIARQHLAGTQDAATTGTGASTGIAVGCAAFDAESAQRLAANGQPVILVRPDTSTADVAGFAVSAGIVTALGGRTAHAALVARQMAKPCIVGCAGLAVDAAGHRARVGAAMTIREGDWLSIDGESGAVYLGRRDVIVERPDKELAEVESWRAHEKLTAHALQAEHVSQT